MNNQIKYEAEKSLLLQLDLLLSNFNGNKSKLKEILQSFIRETPSLFDQIDDSIKANDLTEASRLMHKTKTRFGYLGLNEEMEILSGLENELGEGRLPKNAMNQLDIIKKTNINVIEFLKNSDIYKSDENVVDKILPLSDKLVMIAEDDEINAMVFELFIKETGAEVIVANDGNQALKMALEKKPDFIFMDVHMPYFSGIEAINELRNKGVLCPIISLSASTRLNEQKNSIAAGANDFIIKPVNKSQIHEALYSYLG